MVQNVLRGIGLFAGIALVLPPIIFFLINYRKTPGRSTGNRPGLRRGPGVILISVAFFALEIILWKPLPVPLPVSLDQALTWIGFIVLLPSVGLYLWGIFTLNEMFAFSSSTGADLFPDHKLVQHGPYRYSRHPMYLGFIFASIGAILLFHNWTSLSLIPIDLVLTRRASLEEKVLGLEFGDEWQGYAANVPKWFRWRNYS